jgi:lysophospholipase L1-like esterase
LRTDSLACSRRYRDFSLSRGRSLSALQWKQNMPRVFLLMLLALNPLAAQTQQATLNLVALDDSLTEGVSHLNGEQDTYPFMVSQQFPGSTYVKLGYRGQTTFFLGQHLDGFLFTLLKPGYQNVLVLWAGTNDLATGAATVQAAYSNLVAMARIAHAAGWQVVAVTMIARRGYFTTPAVQAAFPAEQAAINSLIRQSAEFDAVADPAAVLTDPTNATYYWDAAHLQPAGYQIVANLVTQAIRELQTPAPLR